MTWVFRLDGSLQGIPGEATSLEAARANIESAGLQVLRAERRQWPGVFPMGFGLPTGNGYAFYVNFGQVADVAKKLEQASVVSWPERPGSGEFLRAWETIAPGSNNCPWFIRRGLQWRFGEIQVPKPANDPGGMAG